jgi:hypothetical protein
VNGSATRRKAGYYGDLGQPGVSPQGATSQPDRKNVNYLIACIARDAGLPHVNPHMLRHYLPLLAALQKRG